jgi:FtsP/CotA-like multicopper oxidase with cupredoxin domain
VHVYPFQVIEVVSSFLTRFPDDNASFATAIRQITDQQFVDIPRNWRDTILVPPFGMVRIWIRFNAWPMYGLTGKTVMHCHFMAHEETGMMANWRLNERIDSDPDGRLPLKNRWQ